MKVSLFRNLRLQTYLQLLNTVIPLITTPYVARILGADGIGVFSFSTSNASYFTLFAMLGTISYGTRAIANERNEKNRWSIFNEIYALQLICVITCSFFYFIYAFTVRDNKEIAFLQLITLLGYLFDISWLYFGLEDFKSTVLCNFVYRVLGCASIFLFVKQQGHLWIYTVIMLGSVTLCQITLWCNLISKRKIKISKIEWRRIKKHIKPNLLLFIPLVAMTINHNVDKTMLGMFSSYEQVGFYYNVEKIINVPFSIITGIGTVLLPRMTVLYSNDAKKADRYFNASLNGMMMVGIIFCFVILIVSKDFVPLFLGEGYDECIYLVKIFAPVLIVKCLSNSIANYLLIPCNLEKIYIKSSITGAIINIVANRIFIPKYGALGAELATIFSESIALIIQIFFANKSIHFISLLKDGLSYCLIGIFLYFAIKQISIISGTLLVKILLEGGTSLLVFFLFIALYWKLSKNDVYLMLRHKKNIRGEDSEESI